MSFLKKLGFAVLLVLLLSVAANAGAEYPVDPTFSQMRAFKQEELRNITWIPGTQHYEILVRAPETR